MNFLPHCHQHRRQPRLRFVLRPLRLLSCENDNQIDAACNTHSEKETHRKLVTFAHFAMPAYTTEKACSTFTWLCCFVISIFISVHPLNNSIPADCLILDEAEPLQTLPDNGCPSRAFAVQVDGRNFTAYICYDTNSSQCSSLESDLRLDVNQTTPCWTDRDTDQQFYCFSSSDVMNGIRDAASSFAMIAFITTPMSVVFGILVLISFSSIFKPEIIRLSPQWLLTLRNNISSRITRYRPESQPLPSEDTMHALRLLQPPRSAASATSRRIRRLVETTKLSDQQVKQLDDEAWTCCICLGERAGDDGKLASVSRLYCGHATHSECLQSWLEKGRAVCPLCNTDVFLPDIKGSSSKSSSGSGFDDEGADSLHVEPTEGAPSSPGNSVRIDMSQHQPTVPAQPHHSWDQFDGPHR